MKKNNFFKVALLAAVTLSGMSFEARGMENKTLQTAMIVGTGVVLTTALLVKNTATYKTYNQHHARLLEEKQKSDNPFVHAQSLNSTGVESNGIARNDKAEAFLKQDEEKIKAYYNKQTKKNDLCWEKKQIFDSYEPDKK